MAKEANPSEGDKGAMEEGTRIEDSATPTWHHEDEQDWETSAATDFDGGAFHVNPTTLAARQRLCDLGWPYC